MNGTDFFESDFWWSFHILHHLIFFCFTPFSYGLCIKILHHAES